MKKIFCLAIALLICSNAVYAMNLDGIKGHFLKGEWKDGIREGEALLANAGKTSPGLDELYYYLALCYMKDGNYLRTSDICEIIMREFPSSKFTEQAHYVLIDAYSKNGNSTEAQAQAQDFLKRYPDSTLRKDVEVCLAGIPSKEILKSNDIAEDTDIVLARDIIQGKADVPYKAIFMVQVGAFSNKKNADSFAKRLRAAKYSVLVAQSVSKGKPVYKVRVGPYYSREEAQAASFKLSREGYPTKVIP